MLSANLHLVLPRHWKGAAVVPGYMRDGGGLPQPGWFRTFWAFVGADNMHLFSQWPVIPLTTGELVAASALAKVLTLPARLPALPDVEEQGQGEQGQGRGGSGSRFQHAPVSLYDFGAEDATSA